MKISGRTMYDLRHFEIHMFVGRLAIEQCDRTKV